MKSLVARTLERHFLKAGKETEKIRLFESLTESRRLELASRLSLDREEEPVIVASLSTGGFLVLSAKRAVVDSSSGVRSLPYSAIDQVTVDRGRETLLHGRGKSHWRTLVIELVSGERLTLETEPGKGFWGLFNAFKFQADRSPGSSS